jgi:hypothetical protein
LSLVDHKRGDFVRSVEFRVAADEGVVVPQRMLGAKPLAFPANPVRTVTHVDSIPLLSLDEKGTVQDTIAWRVTGQSTISVATRTGRDDGGRGVLTIGHPFDRRSLWASDPLSRWVYLGTWRLAEGDREDYFELLRITETSDTLAVTRLPFDRVPVSREKIREYARGFHDRLPHRLRSQISPERLVRLIVSQVARPTSASTDAIMPSEDGTIWFRRSDPFGTLPAERWVAYRREEGFVGCVDLPVGHSMLAASGGLIWTTTVDSLGLPTVTGWSVAWG